MRRYAQFLIPFIACALGCAALVTVLGRVIDTSNMLGVRADADFSYPPIPCSRPCVIEWSPGGVIDLFAAQGRELAATHTPVIVDGMCASACTILVDIARDTVCVTRDAVLAYHKGEMQVPGAAPTFISITYDTPGLQAFITAHGGLPDPDSGHLLMLTYSDLIHFYKPCAGADAT